MKELREGVIGPTWDQMQPGIVVVQRTVLQEMSAAPAPAPIEEPISSDSMASLYHNRERTMRIAEMAPFCGGIGHAYEI